MTAISIIETTQRALAERLHVARSSSPCPGLVTRRARMGGALATRAPQRPHRAAHAVCAPPGRRPGARLRHEHHVGRIQQRVQRGAPRAAPQRPRARPRVEGDRRAGAARRGHGGHDHRRRQLVKQEPVDDERARAPQRLRGNYPS